VPASIDDNPYLQQEEYKESLRALGTVDPLTMKRLLEGDWSVSEDSRFRRDWIKYYGRQHDRLTIGKGCTVNPREGVIFAVVDPAMTEKEGPGDTTIFRKQPSFTVIGVFLLTRGAHPGHLLWLDHRRFRKEIPEVFHAISEIHREWFQRGLSFIGMEYTSQSQGLFQICQRAGLPMRPFKPYTQDKVARSVDAANRMEAGQIWFPGRGQVSPECDAWIDTLEDEVFTWTGDHRLTDDQVDVLSYAARFVSSLFPQKPAAHILHVLESRMPASR